MMERALLLLCVLASGARAQSSAQDCTGNWYTASDQSRCFEAQCAAIGCSFGCINPSDWNAPNTGGPGSCDSHSGGGSPREWNDREMEESCGCVEQYGTLQCQRIPCRAPGGDDSCLYARDGMCDELTVCDAGTDCSDCGECYSIDCTGDCEAAAAGVLVIFLCICLVSCIALGGGIYCCIESKSKQGRRPTGMAWLASLVICIFIGPLCMWIPFVIDSCYEPVGGRQTTVVVQQVPQHNFMVSAQPVMGQPVPVQPVMVQAQPMMAMAQAQPMMATAQAQPMSKTAQGP